MSTTFKAPLLATALLIWIAMRLITMFCQGITTAYQLTTKHFRNSTGQIGLKRQNTKLTLLSRAETMNHAIPLATAGLSFTPSVEWQWCFWLSTQASWFLVLGVSMLVAYLHAVEVCAAASTLLPSSLQASSDTTTRDPCLPFAWDLQSTQTCLTV